MRTLEIIIGDTTELSVEIEDGAEDADELKLTIYASKSQEEGFTGELLSVEPSSYVEGVATFIFETEGLAFSPKTLFGRFHIENNSKKSNTYFKLKFVYSVL